MKLTTEVKVKTDNPEKLSELIKRFNTACNWLSETAFTEGLWHWHSLQKRAYHELRKSYGLSAAASVVAVRKVAHAYRNRKRRKAKVTFRPLGAIPLFKHIYYDDTVSFFGLKASYTARPDISLPKYPREGKLIYRQGDFYIHQTFEATEPKTYQTKGYLGCDMGIKNILTDSNGAVYSGGFLNNMRKRHIRLRAKLQSKGTRSARRLLKKRSKKERRFARDINHQISKRVVVKAQTALLGIALEALGGIRGRTRFRKAHRYSIYSWSFEQLRSFIEYKAKLNGVPVVLVDPRNTSRTCPTCGHCDRKNRQVQGFFKCIRCGFGGLADAVAAGNIACRADGDLPYESPSRGRFKSLVFTG